MSYDALMINFMSHFDPAVGFFVSLSSTAAVERGQESTVTDAKHHEGRRRTRKTTEMND